MSQQYRLRLERTSGEGESRRVELLSEYDTATHEIGFTGTLYPKDMELFGHLVGVVKHLWRDGRLPRRDEGASA